MTIAEPIVIRWGPPAAVEAEGPAPAEVWTDLAPDRRPGDWLELLRRLAAMPGERPVLLLGAGVWLANDGGARLERARAHVGPGAIIGALDNLDPALSPLPPTHRIDAPLDVVAIDRLCYWLAERTAFAHSRPPLSAALWPPSAARLLLAANWRPSEPLPEGIGCWICDHVFAGRPDRPLAGPGHWPVNEVPPPTSPLDTLRARWPNAAPDDDTPELTSAPAPAPTGPAPGLGRAPVVLHVCHGWGGGSARFIHDLAAADHDRCHLLLSAHGSTPRQAFGEWLELRPAAAPGLLLARYPLAPVIADTALRHNLYAQALRNVLDRWCVDAVMVSSLIGHGLEALTTGRPTVLVCHDYYPLWPELHCDFGDSQRRFDRPELERDLQAGSLTLFAPQSAHHWWQLREAFVAAVQAARPTLAAPTRQVHANWTRIAPELAGLDWRVIPHGIAPWPAAESSPAQANLREKTVRLRVLVPGRIAGGKGVALIRPLLSRLDPRVELVFVGAGTAGAELHGRRGIHVLHDYQREELPRLVAAIAPDLALLPATVAETFGYLLSELQSLGLPVLATTIGSYAERIRDGIDGLLVPPEADAIAARLAALADDPSPLAAIRTRLTTQPMRDSAAMAADYRAALPLMQPPAVRYPLRISDSGDLRAAAQARYALELDGRRRRLQSALDASESELARRAAWGHALQRQFDERTRWAKSLEADLAERMAWIDSLQAEVRQLLHDRSVLQGRANELEAVYRSRSWRLMAPFRALARKLRALRTRLAFQLRRLRNLGHRMRLSLATRGLAGTLRHWRHRRGAGAGPVFPPAVVTEPVSTEPPARLPTSEAPTVSIVVPIHGKLAYTCACLASLAEHAGPTPFEVIVVDDASPDDSAQALAGVEGLRLIRNAENLGFVGSCNAGAAAARGRWLVFLNNDTTVTPGWLEALLATHEDFDRAGLIGARLVYPDGRLQEAGGLVFSDGSGWNYGRFDDPADPRYGYARESDYCSGAAILIERVLFERLGGFDARYAPAYYEDTDLAFKVHAAGLRVICQPAATVIHYEGVTSGTDIGAGIKRYQVVNQDTFKERWSQALARQPAPGTDVERIVRAAPAGRVLVIDATTPEPDQDSGSVRLVHLLRLLRESGRHVTFFADNRAYVAGYTERLQRLGVEVLYHPWLGDPVAWLREHGPQLDAVLVCRHYIAANYLGLVRQYAPRARFIFDTVDLHYLREERAAALAGSEDIARQAARTRAQEQRLIRAADVTLVVSPAEQALLARELPGARVEVLSNVHPVHGSRRAYAERRDLLFVGGFQHPPNIDAVTWFAREVFPAVRAALPDVRFHVIGSKTPPAILALAGDGIEVHGHVPDLEPYLDGCRIALAPLRYGAGVKGKINMSMSYGQPVVATEVAVEGMRLVPDEEALVADTPEALAAQIVRLYRDEALWNRLSTAGLDNVRRHFSFDAAREAIEKVFGLPGKGGPG